MKIDSHMTLADAAQLQRELAMRLILEDDARDVDVIVSGDLAYNGDTAYCVAVAFSYPQLETLEVRTGMAHVEFPYISGFLSFRECPLLLDVIGQLSHKFQLAVFDAQGTAHPRALGLASHAGLLLDVPAIGIAKSLLCGTFTPLDNDFGARSPIIYKNSIIGYALRTRKNVAPVFVSPGHRISHTAAVEWALRLVRKYRVPYPTRIAHNLVTAFKNQQMTLQ